MNNNHCTFNKMPPYIQVYDLKNNLFDEYRGNLMNMITAKKVDVLLELDSCYVVVEFLGRFWGQQTNTLTFTKDDTHYKIHAILHGRFADRENPFMDGVFFVHNLLLFSEEDEYEKIISINTRFINNGIDDSLSSVSTQIPLCIIPRYIHTDDELDFWMQFMDEFLLEHVFLYPVMIDNAGIAMDTQVECLQRMDTLLLRYDLHWHEDLLYKWYNEFILCHIQMMDSYEEAHTPCGEGFVRKAYLYRNLNGAPFFTEVLVFLSLTLHSSHDIQYWSEHVTNVIDFRYHHQTCQSSVYKCLDIELMNSPLADQNDAFRIQGVSIFMQYMINVARDMNVLYLSLSGHDWNTYILHTYKNRLMGKIHNGMHDTLLFRIRKKTRIHDTTHHLERLRDTFTFTNTFTNETHTHMSQVIDLGVNMDYITLLFDTPVILNRGVGSKSTHCDEKFTIILQNHMYMGGVGHISLNTVFTEPIISNELNPLNVRVFDTMTVYKDKGNPLYNLLLQTKRCVFEKVKRSCDWHALFHSVLNDPKRFAFRRRKLLQWFEEDSARLHNAIAG